MKRTAILTLILAASACTGFDDRPTRLGDLSQFVLSPVTSPGEGALYLAHELEVRASPPGEFVVVRGDETWVIPYVFRTYQPDAFEITLSRVGPEGSALETQVVDLLGLGLGENHGWLGGAVFDPEGHLWVLISEFTQAYLAEIDLADGTLLRRLATLPRPGNLTTYGNDISPEMALAAAGNRLYVGSGFDLVAIDARTGSVVQEYDATVIAATAGEVGSRIGWLAATEVSLLVKLSGVADCLVMDPSTGELRGRLAGEANRGMAGREDGTFVGLTRGGELVRFEVGAAVPDRPILGVRGFDRSTPWAITAADGRIWVLFHETDRAELVAYDPDTWAPVEGFRLAKTDLAEFADARYAHALAAHDGAFYLALVTPQELGGYSSASTHLLVLDLRTGLRRRVMTIPNVAITGLCSADDTLVAVSGAQRDPPSLPAAPSLHWLDVDSATVDHSDTLAYSMGGLAALACGDGRYQIATDGSRLEVERTAADPAADVFRALPVSSAAGDMVRLGEATWYLDRRRNLVWRLGD